MRRTGTKTASVNNLTVDTAGLQSLLSAGYPTAVEIGTAAGARITVGRNSIVKAGVVLCQQGKKTMSNWCRRLKPVKM